MLDPLLGCARFFDPATDGPCSGPDHPLGIGEDDELLALQGVEAVDYLLLDHWLHRFTE